MKLGSISKLIICALISLASFAFVVINNQTKRDMAEFLAMASRKPVGAKIPEDFPLLVVSPGSKSGGYGAKVVFHGQLKQALSEMPNYTYLVPGGNADKVNDWLFKHADSKPRSFKGNTVFNPAEVEVKALPDGKQLLKVGFYGIDDVMTHSGWYEASARSARPLYYQSYQEEAFPVPLLVSSILLGSSILLAKACLLLGTVWLGILIYKRRKYHSEGWVSTLQNVMRGPGWVVLFFASNVFFIWTSFHAGHWMFENGIAKHAVTEKTIWHGAPVLILAPAADQGQYNPVITRFECARDYMESHPGSTFLIPKGKDADISRQLKALHQYDDFWETGRFQVIRQLPNPRQYLKIVGRTASKDVQTSYYEAGVSRITPRYWNSQWSRNPALYAILVNVILWLAIHTIAKRSRTPEV